MTNGQQQGCIVIRREASVFCGLCGAEKSLYQGSDRYSLLAAEMDARSAGWKKRLRAGWVCPDCQNAPAPPTATRTRPEG